MTIDGKTILITGASQGIGRFLAGHFATRGCRLVLTARNEANLDETASQAEAAGAHCFRQPSDLRVPDTLERLAEAVRSQVGGVDVLINNAADVTSKPLLDSSLDEIDGLIRTNVIGCLQLTRLIVPMMQERGGGTIVNISSLAGCKPNPTQTVYSISKAAVNGISEALRAELRGTGIHVLNVALSSVALPQDAGEDGTGRGRGVPVEQFAVRLERAIDRRAAELYLSPVTKWLMRLYKLCPPLMYLR